MNERVRWLRLRMCKKILRRMVKNGKRNLRNKEMECYSMNEEKRTRKRLKEQNKKVTDGLREKKKIIENVTEQEPI